MGKKWGQKMGKKMGKISWKFSWKFLLKNRDEKCFSKWREILSHHHDDVKLFIILLLAHERVDRMAAWAQWVCSTTLTDVESAQHSQRAVRSSPHTGRELSGGEIAHRMLTGRGTMPR